MKKYFFRKYQSEYRKFFTMEKNRLRKVLDHSAKIEHIGSTAIAGLGGKGIIDIVIGVSKSKITESKTYLEEAGYEFRKKASYPERLFFRRDYQYKNGKRRIHIHLVKFDGTDWKEMVSFRNYLLKHPKVIDRYVEIKKVAVKKAQGEGEVYRKYKEKFIKSITKKALSESAR